jgi:hypothetical protein
MDIEKLIQREEKRHAKTMVVLQKCKSLGHLISHISEEYIFTNDFSMNEMTDALHMFKCHWGLYCIDAYYMSGYRLAVSYRFEDYDHTLVAFCTDVEEMLKKISGGKCRVEKRVTEEEIVVCNA